MRSKESTTLPTTAEELAKLVRSIVAETFRCTADFCDAMDELPSTGDDHKAQRRRKAVLEALARAMEPLIAARAKENQKEHGGTAPGRGKTLCQKSDRVNSPIDTQKEAAALAGVSHDTFHKGKVALDQGSTPTPARPGTPTLGGQDQRTTDVATHESQNGDRGS